jgi:hypothetical protein
VSYSIRCHIAAVWPPLLLLTLTACRDDKGIATEAIKRADRFVATVQANGAKVMPEETRSLADSLAVAKSLAAAGKYGEANNKAVETANAAIEMARKVGPLRAQLEKDYKRITDSIGPAVNFVVAKAKKIRATGRPPKGMTAASFDSLTKVIEGWESLSKEASDAYAAGEISQADRKAAALKGQVLAAIAMLGLGQ